MSTAAAAVARGLGCEATLVTDTPQPMGDALGDEPGATPRTVHDGHGVRIETGLLVDMVRALRGYRARVAVAAPLLIGSTA
ncbi:hypothetical protein SGFS_064030 [Streptomyces graminofaciens]|uniref:Uncharacterized protein n=1 Tax=Streptomyces graminofaciens TaxID=68212 RepID=A0ABN5VP27_9ACTN|nr:hypothetical protein [Streptomyces graminofaciens]BBC35109.1 hypothetical protein SGFS_064030 [Streptomyces graminofaciens]